MKPICLLAIFHFIFFLHCTKNTVQPQLNPEISNQPDQFEFKITDVRSITNQIEYRWQNNGINANIYNFSNIAGGSAILTIIDRAGEGVYSGDLNQSGDFFSSAGAAGVWTIKLKMTEISGTVHFRIERRP